MDSAVTAPPDDGADHDPASSWKEAHGFGMKTFLLADRSADRLDLLEVGKVLGHLL